MIKRAVRVTLNSKLIIYTVFLLLFTAVSIGIPSFLIARESLEEKGRIILMNGVNSALHIIEEKNKEVLKGTLPLKEAQESVKELLMGPMDTNGNRQITSNFDFGANGYFIIYSLSGNEVLHPTLEGTNVWNVVDKNPDLKTPYYFVQDKIEKAIAGGDYTQYTWTYPYSEELGEKIVYSKYDPNWGWVVTAGTYKSDFNKEANAILSLTLFLIGFVVLIGLVFSANYIASIATPLMALEKAMKASQYGEYKMVEPIKRKDEIGKLYKGYNHMIHAIKEAHTRIEYFAYYDTITGLPNKNMLENRIKNQLMKKSISGNLVLVDVKDFGVINSIYGSSYGDHLILELANVLKEITNDCYRISGNTFAIWIEPFQESELNAEFAKVKIKIDSRLHKLGISNKLDFYVSCTHEEKALDSLEEYFKHASLALQYAKSMNIYNDVIVYKADLQHLIEDENAYKEELVEKIGSHEFYMAYQPIVNIETMEVIGVEALARWKSPKFGHISPGVFIPLITKYNLMIPFSKHVIENSLSDFRALQKKYGSDIYISLNISPIMFLYNSFETFIVDISKKMRISPEKIVLEITEDVFISDILTVKNRIAALNSLGFKISLDDFGSGYSSLNYLKTMQFNQIKIDKIFIEEMHQDAKSYTMFKSIVEIAHTFGARVVAEGVEELEQVALIKDAGCQLIQGYYYYKPEPI